MCCNFENKSAFTLAETLITLVIVGVVAAITLPIIMHNIWEKTKAERLKNIKQKLSKSTDEMLATSGLNGYSSTEDFLNTFKKHMKITQICRPEEIAKCWGSKDVVTDEDGYKWDISRTKETKYLRIPSSNKGYKDVMGIVTADGTPIILSYDTDCNITLKDGRTWTQDGLSSSVGCLSGVYDWNGGKKPNELGDDVLTFNSSGGLGPNCSFRIGEKCYLTAQPVTAPLSYNQCVANQSALGISKCGSNSDQWAAAVKICGGVNKMVSQEDLTNIAKEIYGMNINANNYTYCKNGTKCFTSDNKAAQKLGITPGSWVWSAEEFNSGDYNGLRANLRRFSETSTYYGNYCTAYRNNVGGLVLCKGD